MSKNTKITDYFFNLIKNNEICETFKKKINDFILNGTLMNKKYLNKQLNNNYSADTNYLVKFLFLFATTYFDQNIKSLYENNNVISAITSISKNIHIKIRDEFWKCYITIFKDFKNIIWNYISKKNISIKLNKNIFFNVYIQYASYTIFIKQCSQSFYLNNDNLKNTWIEIMFFDFIDNVLKDLLIDDKYEEEIKKDLHFYYADNKLLLWKETENIFNKFMKPQLNNIKIIHWLNTTESIISSNDGIVKLDLLRKLIGSNNWESTFKKIENFFNEDSNLSIKIFELKITYKYDWFENYNRLLIGFSSPSLFHLFDINFEKSKDIFKDIWITCFKIIGTLTNSANHEVNFIYKLNGLLLEGTFLYMNNHINIFPNHSKFLIDLEEVYKNKHPIRISINKSKELFFKLSVVKIHDFFNFIDKINFENRKNIFQQIFCDYLKSNMNDHSLDLENSYISVYGYFLYLSSITIILESNNINIIAITFLYIKKIIDKKDFIDLIKFL